MTAGQRWAHDELGALRAGRYRPAAWHRFLAAAFRRAAARRQARPELVTQGRAWSAGGMAAGLIARRAAAARGLPAPPPTTWLLWSAATAAMLDWHLGMLEGEHGEHRDRLRAADALTLTRIGLVPFIAAADRGTPFSALVAGAAATDLADGRLARRTGTTRLGRDLDTIADAIAGAAAVRSASRNGWLTPTTARLTTLRQLAPIAVVASAYFRTGSAPPHGAYGDTRLAAPAVLGGLALAPHNTRVGDRLARAGSALALATALARSG